MRALKITVLVSLLTTVTAAVALVTALAMLARSETGSRWLLEQGIALSPISIEASGLSGTLAQGLRLDTLRIRLPAAEIRAGEIEVRWSPASLLARVVDIDSARIGELAVELRVNENSGEPKEDALFWLRIPFDIAIGSGHLRSLRVDTVQFEQLTVAGTIGRGRLKIETLDARTGGLRLQASGKLAGPSPGRLQATASWALPAQNLVGNGRFDGSIEALGFSQVVEVPETVHLQGTIHDLFAGPSLTGVATWSSVRVPGELPLYSTEGEVSVTSDFRSASLQGNSVLQHEGWPRAYLRTEAFVDGRAVTIHSYALDALNGQVTGSGRIEYGAGLSAQVAIKARGIDTVLLDSELPGRLDLDAALRMDSVDTFLVDVTHAQASITGRELSGRGSAQWRDATLSAVDARVEAGGNRVTADVELGRQLAGTVRADITEPGRLWPGLQGVLEASVTLGGSIEAPQAEVAVHASALSFDAYALEALALSGALHGGSRIDGELTATGLRAGEQPIGRLAFSLSGSLDEHRSTLALSEGPVALVLRASGGWDGEILTERFDDGHVQPEGFERWQLRQEPWLRVSATGARLSEHCWQQGSSGICVADSRWEDEALQSRVAVKNFALASLQPLMVEGLRIDGTMDADLGILRDSGGLQGELNWRQSRTNLRYTDNGHDFQTVLDKVEIDAFTDPTKSRLTATLSGEQGLRMSAMAVIDGALSADSPLQAQANGRLPDIELLRPLVQQTLDPGELGGELTVGLDVGGTLGDPLFTGGARLNDGRLGLPDAGVVLTGIDLAAESKGTDRLRVTGVLHSGEGSAEITGEIRAVEDTNLEANLRIRGQSLAAVRAPDLSVDTSPDLRITVGDGIFDVSGILRIPRATAEIRDLPRSAVQPSTDVVVHSPEGTVERQQGTIVTGNIEVVLGDDVRFVGFGLTSRLEGELRLTQSRGGFLRSEGTVRVRDGFLTGYGKELRVDRGELTFTGALDDPLINIQVSRETVYEGRRYTIGLRLTGTARNVKTEPFSRPAMSDRDVLSFLLLDRPATSDSDASGAALALGLQQLLPDQSGVLGLDEVGFETNEADEAAVVAGKRINDRLHVRYVFGSQSTAGSFRIRYTLGRGFSLEASTGSSQSMDLIYILER